MSMKENVQTIAENVPKVYEAGQASMVDESKIIEKTASGTDVLTLEDVSEIPHDVKIQLSSDTVEDFSTTEVKVTNVNILPYPYVETTKTLNGITYTDNGDGSVTMKGTATGTSYFVLASKRMLDLGEKTIWHTSTSGGYRLSQYLFYNGNNGATSINFDSGVTVDETVFPMVVVGDVLPEYQPYTGQAYTPNVDGTVNVKSVSPVMNIFCDTDGVNIIAEYHKSYGMQVEYDRFWDDYQRNGNPEGYEYAFAGQRWNSENWKPKYPIKLNGKTYLSSYTGLFNYFDRGLEKAPLELPEGVIDFTNCRSIADAFANANITKVEMNALPAENHLADFMTRAFAGGNISAVKLKTVKIGTNENIGYASTFTHAYALENVSFVDGSVIGKAVSFEYSTRLTKQSIENIIHVLSDTTSGISIRFSLKAVNNAFETAEGAADGASAEAWTELIATKPNWTISLI